jgi:uncharacterized protein involved in cysteine biosynthesis
VQVWTLVGIYFVIAIMAVVIAGFFVDQLPDDKKRQKRKPSAKEIGNNVMATIRHMKKPNQLLLMPVTVFSGMAITFFSAEYTKVMISFYSRKEFYYPFRLLSYLLEYYMVGIA